VEVLGERLRDAHPFCDHIQTVARKLSAALQPIAASLEIQASALASTWRLNGG
jgi:hypothetical protein